MSARYFHVFVKTDADPSWRLILADIFGAGALRKRFVRRYRAGNSVVADDGSTLDTRAIREVRIMATRYEAEHHRRMRAERERQDFSPDTFVLQVWSRGSAILADGEDVTSEFITDAPGASLWEANRLAIIGVGVGLAGIVFAWCAGR